MSIVYLDIDGVLVDMDRYVEIERAGISLDFNSSPEVMALLFDKRAVRDLNTIISSRYSTVVVHSQWAVHEHGRQWPKGFVKQCLTIAGVYTEYLELAPPLMHMDVPHFHYHPGKRVEMIQRHMLSLEEIPPFVILDDCSALNHKLAGSVRDRFVHVTEGVLEDTDVEKADNLLDCYDVGVDRDQLINMIVKNESKFPW